MHRRQHLDVPARVQPELLRDTPRHHVHRQPGRPLGVLLREQEEIHQPLRPRRQALVDPVRVGHHPRLLRLPEDPGQPHRRNRAALGEHVPQHLSRADGR